MGTLAERVYPNDHLFFCRKIWNFKVLLKQSFFSLQQKKKYYSCTQKATRVFIAKCKILQFCPNGHLLFLQQNTKFWKLYSNGYSFYGHPFFDYKAEIFLNCTQMAISFFDSEIQNSKLFSNSYSFFDDKIEVNSFFKELWTIWKNKQNYWLIYLKTSFKMQKKISSLLF